MNLSAAVVLEDYKYLFGRDNEWAPPFTPDETKTLRCARGDWAAAQLLLYSGEETMVTLDKAPCFYERYPVPVLRVEARCPGLDVRLKLVGLVKDDDGQWRSDALLHETFLFVERRRVQPVWIQAQLPPETVPGVYTVELAVYESLLFAPERRVKTLALTIEVLPAVLKGPASGRLQLDLWQHNTAIARTYQVPLWSERHFELMREYVRALAALGQKAISVVASEIPWTGQWSNYNRVSPANTYEYSIIPIYRAPSGVFRFDFSHMNRYIALCMEEGIREEIELFGLMNIWTNDDVGYGSVIEDYPDAVRLRYYDEKDGVYRYVTQRETLQAYLSAIEENLAARGWAVKARILCDEPSDLHRFKETLRFIRQAAPSLRFKAAINHIEFIGEEIPGLCDYVPGLECVCEGYDKLGALRDKVAGRLSYYVCWGPDHPNTLLRSPLAESRIMPWLSWYLGFDGFLRWNFTVWPERPFSPDGYFHHQTPVGDTHFVYPGRDGSPVYSLRYMNLLRGLRDIEILDRYAEKRGREAALEKLRAVFRFSSLAELSRAARRRAEELYAVDTAAYDAVIEELLAELGEGADAAPLDGGEAPENR